MNKKGLVKLLNSYPGDKKVTVLVDGKPVDFTVEVDKEGFNFIVEQKKKVVKKKVEKKEKDEKEVN